MCGILATLFSSKKTSSTLFQNSLEKLRPRGPDATQNNVLNCGVVNPLFADIYMGFARLSINDLSIDGMQPMRLRFMKFGYEYSLWLICNGEIFNHEKIINAHNFAPNSKSDCEAILHLYWKYVHHDTTRWNDTNISTPYEASAQSEASAPSEEDTLHSHIVDLLNDLDGEFAFVLYDEFYNIVVSARDPVGVRPLFWGIDPENAVVAFASELKGLDFCNVVHQFDPGSYHIQRLEMSIIPKAIVPTKYFDIMEKPSPSISIDTVEENVVLSTINKLLRNAVEKRLMSDRPLCCLLSGGLDSSLVAALVAAHYPPYTLTTFSIGLPGSPDLQYAQKVADYIKSNHHSIELTQEDFLGEIETTIKTIESYDTTTVRASVGNLLVAKYIKKNTDFKVVFNGDYSDEVCGGYKYFWNAPSTDAFDTECRALVKNICFFDSLRSDRTISSQGLEARVPFADKEFVKYYINLPPEMRMPLDKEYPEKYLLRKAFEADNVLPPDVLWRPKEAFSDGVSKSDNSWHTIVNTYINTRVTDIEFNKEVGLMVPNTPKLKETFYYRKIFEKEYGVIHGGIIPYYWLPKWCGDLQDPSAREIK
jgi:asparagine synthase (glutamine-hydrolysing)